MKRKGFVFFTTILLLLSMTTYALASVTVKVNPLQPEYNTTNFPFTVNVTGTATNSQAVAATVGLYVSISGDEDFQLIGEELEIDAAPKGTNTLDFVFPWTITDQGIYDIKVLIAKNNKDGATDSSETEVVEIVLEETVIATFPAAPAVAAEILKEAGVSHKYGSGKNSGNFISDVAKEMGPGATFAGISKSNVNEYREAVREFLEKRGAFQK